MAGMLFLGFVLGYTGNGAQVQQVVNPLAGLTRIVMFVLYVVTVFTLRGELEAEPIGIPLGGVMTFFFGAMYFQYHLRDYGGGAAFGAGMLNLTQPSAFTVSTEPSSGPPAGAP